MKPTESEPARQMLADLMDGQGPFDVVEAALLVAREEYPSLDTAAERGRLRALGDEAARRLAGKDNPFERLDALRGFLFEDEGFRGNQSDYYDPRNSFLNEVLDRRTGIPLTLSMVYVEVARAAGLDARGVGLPGHFIVRVDCDDRRLLVDPFHGGEIVTEEDCRGLVNRATGRAELFHRGLLEGSSPREIVARLLRNLKRIYLARDDHERALRAVERLLIVYPDEVTELRDRGFLLAHLERHEAAVADLEQYLEREPHAPDTDAVRARIAWLRRRIRELD